MLKKLLLAFTAIVLTLTLFPFGWLGERSPTFDKILTWLFPEPWGHFWGHLLMFTLVGLALLLVLPTLRTRLWVYLPLVLFIGIAQEAFQLLYKQRPIVGNDITDLIPDLLGGVLGFVLFRFFITPIQRFVIEKIK